jgi:carbon monoxide dehydrogenase subunit G
MPSSHWRQKASHLMDFKGKYHIPARPAAVWAGLHEPEILAAAIPGCETVEKLSPTEFKARAVIKVGPVKARFDGKVELREQEPPPGVAHAMMLKGEGQGGAAGFARGESQVRLSADGDGTLLEYDAKAIVGGRLAQVGQRLIDGVAKALADEFFAKFAGLMHPSTAPAPVSSVPAPRAADGKPSEEGLAPQIWVAGLIGIIVILLIVFSIVL